MEGQVDFIKKKFNVLARQIMDVVEIVLSGENGDQAKFKLVRKRILDAVNDTRRDMQKIIKEGSGEKQGEGI